jgi:DNA topoisomerase-1
MKLVIVESPSKAKKIWGILKNLYPNETWKVTATVGHFMDLPRSKMGIDFKTWTPDIVVQEKKVAKKLLKDAEKATEIYIATDPDREGDGIAACVQEHLQKNQVLVPIHRAAWNEITSKAIKAAIDNPGQLDQLSVDSQRARRMLDRFCGYLTSPLLWQTIGKGLAAGRVQSCVLKMIIDREIERREFVPVTTYRVKAEIAGQPKGVYAFSEWFEDEAEAKALRDEIQAHANNMTVAFNTKQEQRKPFPPFKTSSLLQTAMNVTGEDSKKVMEAMQQLFMRGHITYIRTDSIKLSWAAVGAARDYLKQKKPKLLTKKARNYPAPKGAQAAHEAIRPTHQDQTASKLKLSGIQKDVYNLVWARTLCTQAIPAEVEVQEMTFALPSGQTALRAEGIKLLEPGWRKLALTMPIPTYTALDPSKTDLQAASMEDQTSEPPRRYTELSMIQRMEETNIGRPSTYVATIETLRRHKYLKRMGKVLKPSEKGEVIARYLAQILPELVDVQFTADMEAALDEVADGTRPRNDVLQHYKDWIDPLLKAARGIKVIADVPCPKCGGDLIAKVVDVRAEPGLKCIKCSTWHGFAIDKTTSKYGVFEAKDYDGKCEKCGKKQLTTARSRYGNYVKCKDCGAAQKTIYID